MGARIHRTRVPDQAMAESLSQTPGPAVDSCHGEATEPVPGALDESQHVGRDSAGA
jgi:hypothetical protein